MSKVMIIDGDEQTQKKYNKLFEKEGLETCAASSALEVAEILMREKSDIELILLAMQLGDDSGHEIYGMIRDYTQSIPIIIASDVSVEDQKAKIPYAREYFQKDEGDKVLLSKARMILGLTV